MNMKINSKRFILLALALHSCLLYAAHEASVYTQKPSDPEAFFFTPENYNIKADGKTDVSDVLQAAVNQVKTEKTFGILFIPEGKYLISKTIHVPSAIRLIGYGKNRPEIILGRNTPGYQEGQNYMIWFTGAIARPDRQPQDAGAGTFYSALSNINFRIEQGNPAAVAIRSHFAQHSFISHSVIRIGDGKAGIYDVGNEVENLMFYGGEYGITSGRTSPGWPMMMVDTYFEGQRKAAVLTREVGFAIVRMHVKNTPVAFEMQQGSVDRLHLEDSYFENISRAGIVVSVEDNMFSQLNVLNLCCRNVPTFVHYLQSGRKEEVKERQYHVRDYTYGLIMSDLTTPSHYETLRDIVPLARFEVPVSNDIPALPAMDTWVSVRDFGAKGDGETDDTEAFRKAIAQHKHIYVPQGWYRITETLKLRPGTKLIGLHPFATQFILKESEATFSGFGSPQPVVESSEGGDDILNGIGINTGGYNYRAVGLKWMAGEASYLNDVKFVGGHGTMRKPNPLSQEPQQQTRRMAPAISSPTSPVAAQGLDLAWDNQYWSLWITRNGGGTIKDIWTANTYATSGLYVSNTSTPGRIYAMSLEHHVRNEARFENVANWKVYAFQFEEEGREGKDCRMMEVSDCRHLMFSNLWMYRVIRAFTPQEYGIRLWNCEDIQFRNLHNYTQILPVIEIPVYDVNKKLPVYDWDIARLNVSGKETSKRIIDHTSGTINKLAEGFDFAAGITVDSKGNAYFGENRLKKIYKWDVAKEALSLLADYPWKPFTLATDTKDNLLVVFRYDPQPGYLVNGRQESVPRLPDDNPMYSGWGNSGWAAWAYSINPENPDETFMPLQKIATKDAGNIRRIIHPASRWRGDFNKVVTTMPEYSFLAPDQVTIIPETYDLSRSAALVSVTPGQTEPLYVVHENIKTTVRLDVNADGTLSNLKEAYPRGQYSSVTDQEGNVYIADGEIFVYDKSGKEIKRIQLEERPISLAIGGKDFKTLFATTTKSLYGIQINNYK
ncbi:MAG: SMP-30/gluconolactonase/LRE family protein [Tannerellaceae bacterium]|nr:SMP-30/gluconolactonase/LRE family protein [Tannerellaceae bacterium]